MALGQSSADEIIAQVDKQINSGAAVKMKFKLPNTKGTSSILTDLGGRRARIVVGDLTIVTDGSTVWNYNSATKQLTIDALSNNQNSALKSPQDIFKFGTNYTAEIVSQKGSTTTIKLTPNAQIQSLLSSIGAVQAITLTLSKSMHGYAIKKAFFESSSGSMLVSSVTISPVKSVTSSDFTFTPPSGSRTIDLRE